MWQWLIHVYCDFYFHNDLFYITCSILNFNRWIILNHIHTFGNYIHCFVSDCFVVFMIKYSIMYILLEIYTNLLNIFLLNKKTVCMVNTESTIFENNMWLSVTFHKFLSIVDHSPFLTSLVLAGSKNRLETGITTI